jgi:purine-cytosine permease-like protein
MKQADESGLVKRLDAMYEFDREPVSREKLYGFKSFLGIYAGEHVAGTEFVIGPLFVVHGVTAGDLFGGLIVGNLLAVLSWTFVCAPIAVRNRLTLYWQLRGIAGPYLTYLYSIVNALMFCFLAGAMISVAATAVGLPFDMPMPQLSDTYPTSISWILIVILVGSVVTTLAILGFERISHFARVCVPWMFLVFVAAAVAVLPRLGCNSLSDFWRVANEQIWTGVVVEGQSKFTFWHVMFFSWFCNLAMHIGMSDLTILRYARKWHYGLASAPGMYLGHFVAWIASGILCAAALGSVAPGPIAYMGAGFAGAVCVVIAGWTTANPTLYRAGLAFQVATPNWKRWKVTLATGLATTVAACFPALVMKLLDFVALYGLLLMPMGAVIFTDFWIFPKLGLEASRAKRRAVLFSWPAFSAWVGSVGISFLLPLEIFFKALPAWFIAVALYVSLSYWQQMSKRHLEGRVA